jgi:hypothetical protein
METSSGTLEAIAHLHKVARERIPNLVPETFAFGKAAIGDGRKVEYMIQDFIADAVTLDEVWGTLDMAQKESLVDEIVTATQKVQQLNVPDTMQELIAVDSSAERDGKLRIGGPKHGYHGNTSAFAHFLEKHQIPSISTPTSLISYTS